MIATVRRQVTLAGRAVDRGTGAPLAGALVELVSLPLPYGTWLAALAMQGGSTRDALGEPPDRTHTNAHGRFAFLDLPDGAYELAVSLPGAGSRYGTATAHASVAHDADANAQLAFVEVLVPATSIAGTVRGPGDKPVPLALVMTADGSERTFTDATGGYVIVPVEAGPRRLTVRARGFAPAEEVAELLEAGAEQVVHFTLTVI